MVVNGDSNELDILYKEEETVIDRALLKNGYIGKIQ